MPTSSQVAVVSSSADIEFARRLIADLRDVGLEVLDRSRMERGDPEQQSLQPQSAAVFLAIISPDGLRSVWLQGELAAIRALLGAAAVRRLILVRQAEVALPAELAGHTTVDFFSHPREQAILSLEFAINTALYEISTSGDLSASEPFTPEKVEELEERFGRLEEERSAPLHEPPPSHEAKETLPVETMRAGGMLPPPDQPAEPQATKSDGACDGSADFVSRGGAAGEVEAPAAAPSPWQAPPSPTPPPPFAPAPPAPSAFPPPEAPPYLFQQPDEASAAALPSAAAPGYGDTGSFGALGQSRFLRTDPEAVAIRSTEQVTFTVYHPREIEPREWQQMLVYIALDTPRTLAGVAVDAEERLGNRKSDFRAAPAPTAAAIKRGTRLAIVPLLDGFTFNPPSLRVTWEEDMQRHDFRLRATSAAPGRAANGSIQIYRGVLLLAEVPISIYVRQAGERADIPSTFASIVARAYRRIFASYSHGDTLVVRSCESAAEALGDRYLRDVTLLRSGQEWDERLMSAIGDADIFQLFWSEKAARSLAVEKEWRHALALARRGFIRPVYWTRQPYAIPPELASIHFDRLDLARLGLTGAKMLTFRLFGRG